MAKHYRNQKFIDKVSAKIVRLRKNQGLTQENLVDLTGFDLKQIGRIERGISNPTISSIQAIAEALKVDPKEFFNFE